MTNAVSKLVAIERLMCGALELLASGNRRDFQSTAKEKSAVTRALGALEKSLVKFAVWGLARSTKSAKS